jgi:hypothetical protein
MEMYQYPGFLKLSHGHGQADMLNLIGEFKQILSLDALKVNEFHTNQTEQSFLELSSLTELRKRVPGEKVFRQSLPQPAS